MGVGVKLGLYGKPTSPLADNSAYSSAVYASQYAGDKGCLSLTAFDIAYWDNVLVLGSTCTIHSQSVHTHITYSYAPVNLPRIKAASKLSVNRDHISCPLREATLL